MSTLALNQSKDYEILEKSSKVFLSLGGTFGTAAVSIGFYESPEDSNSFRAFADLANQTTPFDKVVYKGSGLRLVARVVNASGTSLQLIHTPVN